MKTKNHHTSIHQYIERLLRHRSILVVMLLVMFVGVSSFDGRLRSLLQEMYSQGWGWIGTYMHHEHPMHNHNLSTISRAPTIAGPH
jgi:hypothetical protein